MLTRALVSVWQSSAIVRCSLYHVPGATDNLHHATDGYLRDRGALTGDFCQRQTQGRNTDDIFSLKVHSPVSFPYALMLFMCRSMCFYLGSKMGTCFPLYRTHTGERRKEYFTFRLMIPRMRETVNGKDNVKLCVDDASPFPFDRTD